MEILFFFFIIFATVSLTSMLFPSPEYPRALPGRRRRRRRDKEQDEETRKKHRGSRRSTRERKAAHAARGDERTIHNILEDDVISIPHLNQDFVVDTCQTMSEKSWEWQEYRLLDGAEEYTLSVADEGKEIYLSHAIEALEIGYPPPEEIEYDGDAYKLTASGRAESDGHKYKYYTYLGPDEFALMLEDWEGELEFYLGERLHERDINILPGSSKP